jgi:hypothetical protein
VLKKSLWSFFVGAVAFAAAEFLWLILIRPSVQEYDMWVMSPSVGVLIAMTIVATASICLGFLIRPFVLEGIFAMLANYGGVYLSITITYFIPNLLGQSSNIWPIALAVDYVLMAPVICMSWFLGVFIALLAARLAARHSTVQENNEA